MVSLPVLRRQPSGAARATLPGDPAFPRGYAAVVYGCGASLHHSRSAAIVDDSRAPCAGRCIRFRRRTCHFAPKTRTPPSFRRRGLGNPSSLVGGAGRTRAPLVKRVGATETRARTYARRTSSLFAPP